MIQDVVITSALQTVPTILHGSDSDPIEDDLIYVIDIQGLDPVQASISTIDSSTEDGVTPVGESVSYRNLVYTLRPNPDWVDWTPEQLRQAIYAYFMPKNLINQVFTTDELGQVSIDGLVESCVANPFSKDPEYIASVICPKPHFEAIDLSTYSNLLNPPDSWADESSRQDIPVAGNQAIGFKMRIAPTGVASDIIIQLGASLTAADPFATLRINKDTSDGMIELSSIPGQRYLRLVDPVTGQITNIIDSMTFDSVWPMLQPGDNAIAVMVTDDVDVSGITWELTFHEKYGGI